jgi:hypothetical protein
MIREAQYFDAGDIFKLIQAMHAASRYKKFTFDDETVMKFIMKAIEHPSYFCWVGLDKEGEIISGFIGGLQHYTFSKEYLATDYGVYTYPEHRKSRVAFELLKMFMNWAKVMEASEISIGASHGFDQNDYASRLGKFLKRRLGFEEAGAWFVASPDTLHD